MNFLLVDAHRKESPWVKALLNNENVVSTVAGDAEEAIESLRKYEFIAILINSILPDMAGTKLASLTRKLDHQISIFIIAKEASMDLWKDSVKANATLIPMSNLEKIGAIIGDIEAKHIPAVIKDEHDKESTLITNNEDTQIKDSGESIENKVEQSIPKKVLRIQKKDEVKKQKKEIWKKKDKEHQCPVIVVCSWKGGVGKTTTTVNLAAAVQTNTSLQVGLIELTRQTGTMLSHFALTPSITVKDWAMEDAVQDATSFMLEDPLTGMYILPTQTLLNESQDPVKFSPNEVKDMIDMMKGEFNLLVIDSGTILDQVAFSLFQEADHILLVSDMNMETLQENHYMPEILRRRGIETDKLIHILNKSEKGLGMTEKEALSMVDAPVNYVIHANKMVRQKRNEREPFVVANPKNSYTNEIIELAAYILPDVQELQGEENWFKRMMKKIGG